jgi:hypothetical protein
MDASDGLETARPLQTLSPPQRSHDPHGHPPRLLLQLSRSRKLSFPPEDEVEVGAEVDVAVDAKVMTDVDLPSST